MTDERSPGGPGILLRAAGWLLPLATAAHPSLGGEIPADLPARAGVVPSFEVRRAVSDISVDGVLDEAAWSHALQLELAYEVQPGENIPPPVRTEVRVTYDDRRIYFAFRAHDPDPSRIRARFSDRDEAWSDDWVGVAIDTFNDERRAYELLSNPLGVQMDAINDDVQQNYDDSWNAIWQSAGRITESGYEVEMAVPFNQIRFHATNGDAQTWGFDAFRSYPRTDRHHIGLFPRDRGSNSYLSQTVKLTGMEGASPGHNLEILPTLTASRTDTRDALPDGELAEGEVDADVGATVRWGITPNVSLNGALNPDFSQVEADVLRLNVNEQFALFFPETRPFFLEGADYFSSPLSLVHTRVVVDPLFAAKVTGKHGRSTYGVFSSNDEITTMLFPGPEGSAQGVFDLETTDSVGRYRADFGRNSTAGVILTDRRGGGYRNQVAGVDTTVRFTEADRLAATFSVSSTRYSDEMVESLGVRPDEFRGHAARLDYLHTVRDWWINLDLGDTAEGFRADLGFVPQVDVRQWRLGGARVWWGDDGTFHRRMAWGGAAQHAERQNGDLLDESVETWMNLDGPRQSRLSVQISYENRMFDGVQFDGLLGAHTRFEFQATDDLNLAFHQDYGDWIDFANARPATRTVIQPSIRYNVGKHFLLSYIHTYSALDVEGGRLFTVHAPELRCVYQINLRAFVRAIFQYQDLTSDPLLYEGPVDERTRDLFGQFLFAYKFNPQTAIYVGYSDNYFATEHFDMTRTGRQAFIKLAYAWVR